MKYGRTAGKKIILQTDIRGNVNQDELWAILDSVDSDLEEDVDNLMVDSDTEFETIADDAANLLQNDWKETEILISSNYLEAVVHPSSKIPAPHTEHQYASPQPSCSKNSEDTSTPKDAIDFSITSNEKESDASDNVADHNPRKNSNKRKNIADVELRGVLDESTLAERRKQLNTNDKENSDPNGKEKPEVSIQQNGSEEKRKKKINADDMKSTKRKFKVVTKESQLNGNISFNFDGLTGVVDTKDPIKLFYANTDFSLLCTKLASESIRYALQNGREFTITDREMEVFFGVPFFMGLVKLPSLRDYWRTDAMGIDNVRETMPRKRYEVIRANLHFSNNLDPTHANDKAAKIRPLIEHCNKVYQRSLKHVSHQSIDEHMVKFKGHHSMKQYIKNKPIKWGFKFWLRCDAVTGFLYEFDIYTGRKDHPELGLGETVVLDLTKKLAGTGTSIYADNYFSSPTLAARLQDRDLSFVGVVRKDRKGLPKFKEDKRMERGEYEMLYCKEANLMALKWIDNKAVHIISSVINSDVAKVERRKKVQAEKMRVDCPEIMKNYNKY